MSHRFERKALAQYVARTLTPVANVLERVAHAREESDVAYFYELLNAGEMVLKVVGAGLVASLEDDRDRHRYRLEYTLVRADGLGEWASAIDDVLTGPASQVLAEEAGWNSGNLHKRSVSVATNGK